MLCLKQVVAKDAIRKLPDAQQACRFGVVQEHASII